MIASLVELYPKIGSFIIKKVLLSRFVVSSAAPLPSRGEFLSKSLIRSWLRFSAVMSALI